MLKLRLLRTRDRLSTPFRVATACGCPKLGHAADQEFRLVREGCQKSVAVLMSHTINTTESFESSTAAPGPGAVQLSGALDF